MNVMSRERVGEIVFEATVIRADGSREVLGEIAYYNRNPFVRWAHAARRGFRRGKVSF